MGTRLNVAIKSISKTLSRITKPKHLPCSRLFSPCLDTVSTEAHDGSDPLHRAAIEARWSLRAHTWAHSTSESTMETSIAEAAPRAAQDMPGAGVPGVGVDAGVLAGVALVESADSG